MDVKDVTGAASRMQTISVDGYAPGHNHPGRCTRWVYYSLGASPNRTPLPDAVTAWNNIPQALRLPATGDLMGDMPYFLGAATGPRWAGDVNWMYGDVVIATGKGRQVSVTDKPGTSGIIGYCTLEERAAQTKRPILGGGRSYGGWELTSSSLMPVAPPEPPTEEQMKTMRLIRNNTPGDKNYGSVDAMNVEAGFWWHTPDQGYVDQFKSVYGIEVENWPASWWNWWRNLVKGQRTVFGQIAAQEVWNYLLDGYNGKQKAGDRLSGIDKKAGTTAGTTGTAPTPEQNAAAVKKMLEEALK